MKLVKQMIKPSPIPDYWIAQGIDTTADPIIVFQQLKMITVEEDFASEPPAYNLRLRLVTYRLRGRDL